MRRGSTRSPNHLGGRKGVFLDEDVFSNSGGVKGLSINRACQERIADHRNPESR